MTLFLKLAALVLAFVVGFRGTVSLFPYTWTRYAFELNGLGILVGLIGAITASAFSAHFMNTNGSSSA